MMLKDYAKGIVLPDLTDAALKEGGLYGARVAELLLRVPADQRQNVEAEVSRRSTKWIHTSSGISAKMICDPDEVRREILAENGWL